MITICHRIHQAMRVTRQPFTTGFLSSLGQGGPAERNGRCLGKATAAVDVGDDPTGKIRGIYGEYDGQYEEYDGINDWD